MQIGAKGAPTIMVSAFTPTRVYHDVQLQHIVIDICFVNSMLTMGTSTQQPRR